MTACLRKQVSSSVNCAFGSVSVGNELLLSAALTLQISPDYSFL